MYETVEKMVATPKEVMKTMKQAEETPTMENGNAAGELKRRFKKLSLNFRGKDKQQQRNSPPKDQKNADESPSRSFSSFFDSKSSLFSKLSPKSENLSVIEKLRSLEESDWTLV